MSGPFPPPTTPAAALSLLFSAGFLALTVVFQPTYGTAVAGNGGGGGGGGGGAWWNRGPSFGTFPSSVSVTEGETVRLPCVVTNLRDRSVTWMRQRDLHILTAGYVTYSADDRFKAVHNEGSEEWTLVIQFAQLRDAGVYECQVNSDPKISRAVTLHVKANPPEISVTKTKVFIANNTASTKDGKLRVEILGARELFIEEGSSLTLTCVVTSQAQAPPTVIYWYHGNTVMDYNSPRGGVKVEVDKDKSQSTARLLVSAVGHGDSGMYSCVPPGSHPATVLVHVQKGENEAAIQQGGLSTGCSLHHFSSLHQTNNLHHHYHHLHHHHLNSNHHLYRFQWRISSFLHSLHSIISLAFTSSIFPLLVTVLLFNLNYTTISPSPFLPLSTVVCLAYCSAGTGSLTRFLPVSSLSLFFLLFLPLLSLPLLTSGFTTTNTTTFTTSSSATTTTTTTTTSSRKMAT